jgi:hypothetical protein
MFIELSDRKKISAFTETKKYFKPVNSMPANVIVALFTERITK